MRVLLIFLFIVLSGRLWAQEPLPVEVSRVQFEHKVPPYHWNRIKIELKGNHNPDPAAPNPRYVDQITVTLTLGYIAPGGGFTFYQSEATLVTLQVNKKQTIAFWMPSSIVERDHLPKEPEFWVVTLAVAGQSLDLLESNPASFSRNFKSRSSVEGFNNQAARQLLQTDGILVPTYRSPNPYLDPRAPPEFVRRADL